MLYINIYNIYTALGTDHVFRVLICKHMSKTKKSISLWYSSFTWKNEMIDIFSTYVFATQNITLRYPWEEETPLAAARQLRRLATGSLRRQKPRCRCVPLCGRLAPRCLRCVCCLPPCRRFASVILASGRGPRSCSLARRVGGGWAVVHSALNVLHLKLKCYTEQERRGQNSCFTVDKSAIHRVGTQTEKTANLKNSPTPAAPRRSGRTLRKRDLTNRPQCDIITVAGLLRSNQTLSNPRRYVGSVQETDIRCRSLFFMYS